MGLGFVLLWSLGLRIWFGTDEPTSVRYWDERYAFENVRELLSSGGLRPANGFYPSLSYLPQAAVLGVSHMLHRLTGIDSLKVIWQRPSADDSRRSRNEVLPRGFTPTAYLLSRFTQAIFGVASLYLLFLVGRRLLSAEVGLLAALLLSGVFWHIRQSAIFKPDILLVLTCLLVFLLTLEAAERPSRRAYLLVGAAVGLALSSKFNAGPVAIPLVLATVFNRGLGLRIWVWLGLAGAVSVAVFVLLNPYTVLEPSLYIEDFNVTLANYAGRGARSQSSHPYVLWHGLVSLLSRSLHGPAIGLTGLIGGLVVMIRPDCVRPNRRQLVRVGCAMAYAYMLSYAVLYAASTTNPSPHNWLPLAPYVALLAALSLAALWHAAKRRWQWIGRPAAGVVAVSALVLWLVPRTLLYSYPIVLPSTQETLQDQLAHQLGVVSNRVVFFESSERRFRVRSGGATATTFERPSLSQISGQDLDRADAEVFFADRLDDIETAAFYRDRLESYPTSSFRIVEPRLFRTWGPALGVLSHPWRRRGQPVELEPFSFEGPSDTASLTMPEARNPGDLTTLDLRIPKGIRLSSLRIDGDEIELVQIGTRPYFRTARLAARPGVEIELDLRRRSTTRRIGPVRISVQRWTLPRPEHRRQPKTR